MEKIEHYTMKLMEMLNEHIPQPQRSTFMVGLSSILEGIEDRDRIKVFNAVHKKLHTEAKRG